MHSQMTLFVRFLRENLMSWREGFGLDQSGRMVLRVLAALLGLLLAMAIMLVSQ
jgi:hypothetical protein